MSLSESSIKYEPGRLVDDLITQRVFREVVCPHRLYSDDAGSWCSVSCDGTISPHYSTNIRDAWQLIEMLERRGLAIQLQNRVFFGDWECRVGTAVVEADTAAMAICLMMLQLLAER